METTGWKYLVRTAAGEETEGRQSSMIERVHATRSNLIVYPRIVSLPAGIVGIGYLVGYVLLDWISFIEPYAHFNITPWNPGTGLSFALVLLFGRRMIPFLFIGPLLSDLIQIQLPLPLAVTLLVRGPDRWGLLSGVDHLAAPRRAV
jgi:two-component system, LuxR family, sensor kinase FixL